MDAFGDDARQISAENLASVGQQLPSETPETPEPQLPLIAQAAMNASGMEPGPVGKRRVYQSYQGSRFELPQQPETSGFGPKYDAVFQRALQTPGVTEEEAWNFTAKMAHDDTTEEGRNTRLSQSLGQRNTNREDQQTFTREENDKYRSEGVSIADRDRWEQGRNAARMAAARTSQMNPLKIDTANRADMGTLRQGFKEWKNTVNLAIDSKSHKRLATAMANLDSGNAMQEREAAESLVAIFKGGGQVTKASQDLLLKHLAGYVGDVQTWLQHAATGNFGKMELDVLKNATRNALAEEQEKLHGYQESAAFTFGPGSGYEQLAGNVNALVKGAFKQFGYDSPSIYPEEAEPVVLGSGQRPAAPKAKPKIPAGAVMGKMNGKRGYVLNGKFTPVE